MDFFVQKVTIESLEKFETVVNRPAELENDTGENVGLGDFYFGGLILKKTFKIGANIIEFRFKELR